LKYIKGEKLKLQSQLKIDAYSHIVPPKYVRNLAKIAPEEYKNKLSFRPALYDMDYRFRIMDKYEPIVQVLTLGWPPVEDIAEPEKSVDLAKMANDEMAELVLKYPDRFVAAIAALPMNNIEEALKEVDRAITDLRFRGIYLHTPIKDQPLDSPEFISLYEKMASYDLPVFIHPMRSIDYPDYRTENKSKYLISNIFGWPYETTAAMARLVFGGILEKYPGIKFVTHHCGGMVPYYAERIKEFFDTAEMIVRSKDFPRFTKAPIEYFKRFYADTAIYGNAAALMCGCSFFSIDHIIFGVDFPLGDSQQGYRNYRQTINAIEQMNIGNIDKDKIYCDNARKLLRLPV
jgi:predicted TIM-barrel fold metal-dependent hydrolase